MQTGYEKKGNIFTGFIGALIGAVVGIVAWLLLGRLNIIASAVGLVTALLAGKLYDVFGGRQGAAKIVILIVCVLITVIVGSLGNCFWQAYDLYQEEVAQYGEFTVHYAYRVSNVWEYFLALMEESENQSVLIENTLMGLFFSALGCAGVIASNAKTRKAEEARAKAAAAAQQAMYNNPQSSVYMQNPAAGQNAANNQSIGGYSDNTGDHY